MPLSWKPSAARCGRWCPSGWAAALTRSLKKVYRKGLAVGTDPENPEYWGTTGEYDQCYVEMAAIACGILTAPEKLWTPAF